MISFRCPECGERLEASASERGQEVTCPECGEAFTVPRRRPSAARRARNHSPLEWGAGIGCGLLLIPLGLLAALFIACAGFFHSLPGPATHPATSQRAAPQSLPQSQR